MVVQHAVNSNFYSPRLTIKCTQARVLVFSSKAQARYGVDMYIWHRIDGQSKDCRPNGTETLYFAALQTGSSSGASDKIQMIQTAY